MWLRYVPIVSTRQLRARCCALAVLAAAGSMACGGGSEASAPSAVNTAAAAVVVTPSSQTIAVGAKLPLQAQVQDAAGQAVRDATIFWSSSDTTVATVSSVGVVSAKAVGTVQIAASAGGKSAVATLAVLPVPVASVSVLPGTGTIAVGASLALSVATYDAVGGLLPGRQVLWATSAPQIATVDASGIVRGVAGGTATITATSEGKSGASTVTVTAPPAPAPVASVVVTPATGSVTVGSSLALAASTTDASGQTLSGRVVTWSSGASQIATVSSNGVVTAVAPGTATITATSEGKTGSAVITVQAPAPAPAPVATVVVTPSYTTMARNSSLTLTAVVTDKDGNALTGRLITWKVDDSSVATVQPTTGSSVKLTSFNRKSPVLVTATSEEKHANSVVVVQ